jgi:phosphomannomutase
VRNIAGAFAATNSKSLLPNLPVSSSPAPILLSSDARPLTAELVAAAIEGVRSVGCNTIDIGPATTACLAFAVRHLHADGGLAVGNPGDDPHSVGLKFFDAAAMPLSTGGSLEPIVERYETGNQKTARRYGRLHRFQADAPYLAAMAEHYHALRPLRVAVDSASKPWADYFQKLIGGTACEITLRRTTRNEFPQQIRDDAAHLGVRIDGDGETCRAFDEQGREISSDRLLLFLAKNMADDANRLVVVETDTSPAVIERLKRHGTEIIASDPRRAGVPLPDALMTVTLLLKILSRSDEPFSRVLDREAEIV